MKGLFRDLRDIKDVVVLGDVPLSKKTTFKIGGMAAIFVQPRAIPALEKTIEYLHLNDIPFRVLGNGSNLLIDDRGIDVVLSLSLMNRISCSCNRINAGAGCRLMSLSAWSMRRGISGFEKFAGIPASVGGAVCMNAGTPEISFSDTVESVRISGPGGSSHADPVNLNAGYRKCSIPDGTVVSEVLFKKVMDIPGLNERHMLSYRDRKEVAQRTRAVISRRSFRQPLGRPNAGCVFKNPTETPAGMLIDQCGLKGARVGDAEVSTRHANFIVNLGKASFKDVIDLMALVRESVMEQTGFCLEPEVQIWRKG